jgi:hypothetical protein
MSETPVKRRGLGEDGTYLDAARNRYMGAVSLGYGPGGKRIRRKVSGKTKQEVRDKLKALLHELSAAAGQVRTSRGAWCALAQCGTRTSRLQWPAV